MSLRRVLSSAAVFVIVLFAVVLAALAQSKVGDQKPHPSSPLAVLPPQVPGLLPGPVPPFGPQHTNPVLGPGTRFDPLSRGMGERADSHVPMVPGSLDASAIFLEAHLYDSGGQYALSIAAADVNGDGKPDLLVANECASVSNCNNVSVGVLLSNGDGTFQSAVSYGTGGEYAVSVAVGDVNGDGKPDLLVANECGGNNNCSDGSLGVLLGNGDGTFQAAVSDGPGGWNPESLAVADARSICGVASEES